MLTEPAVAPIPQIQGANFLNLLVVDDDRGTREACREVAQSMGFNAQAAESAIQVVDLMLAIGPQKFMSGKWPNVSRSVP